MKTALWLLDKFFGRRIARLNHDHLARLAQARQSASRTRAVELLERLASEDGPHVVIGETEWHQPVRLPLSYVARAHSIIGGATSAGKSRTALLICDAILRSADRSLSFGVLDGKGELFNQCMYLIARRLQELTPDQAQALKERIVIIDLSSQECFTSYNIAYPWFGYDLDSFSQSRADGLQDLFPSGDGLSLRGGTVLKYTIKLLAELCLPFSYFDRILGSEALRDELLGRSRDEELQRYFRYHFSNESRATVAAVRARILSALLSSHIRLALSGQDAPDFRRFQDEGKIVLINVGGPHIARTTARTLQSLLVSDIRQAVFSRTSETYFLWVIDEAAQLFRNRHVKDAFLDLLTLSRSYRVFCLYLTQSLITAVQDGDALESFYTNIKWSLSLRCGTSRDVAFLEQALPVTGQIQKPRPSPYAPPEFLRPSEERALILSRMSSLPDRAGWLWLKSHTDEAIKIKTSTLELPTGAAFQEIVSRINSDASIGQRTPRSVYLAEIGRRESEFGSDKVADKVEQLRKVFQDDHEAIE